MPRRNLLLFMRRSLVTLCFVSCLVSAAERSRAADAAATASKQAEAMYRGPLDVAVLPGERWCVTANELSSTVSLIDLQSKQVIAEAACGARPACIMPLAENEFLVTCRGNGCVERFSIREGRLIQTAAIHVGFEPMGIAVNVAAMKAFVGLLASGEVAELNLVSNSLTRCFSSGNWPRHLALTPDGSRLAVGLSGDSAIAVHDTASGEVLYEEPLSGGINLGHMQCSSDGQHVYFPWMVYRSNPITVSNIQRGWVLASRVARVRLDGPSYREAISLDVPRRAVADPYGLAITPDEQRMVVSSSGTHELLVYRLPDLPFVGTGGPGDLIDRRLLNDQDLFSRIEVGGRPMGLRATADNGRVIVANHTLDCVQIIDLRQRQLTASIVLGQQPTEANAQLVHRGMELFHDAGRSLDQWYSCNSCHLDGGSNAHTMDTWNDGTELTTKTVLPLAGVTATGPWTWHGWQTDLRDAIQTSFTSTMQGRAVGEQEITALQAYLDSLQLPSNPFLDAEDRPSVSAARGRALFESSEVGCANCHSGPRFTDGQIHDVGLGSESEGYNTPSLRGLYRKVRFLHDGRAKTLEKVLTSYHTPAEIGGGAVLSEQQLADLISYLRSL